MDRRKPCALSNRVEKFSNGLCFNYFNISIQFLILELICRKAIHFT